MADSDSTEPEKKRPEPPPIEFVKPGEAQSQQPSQERPPVAWVTRPEDFQRPQYQQPQAPTRTAGAPGNAARMAAILLILAATVSAGYFVLLSITPVSVSDYINGTSDPTLYAISQVCSIFALWGQAIMVLAGIMAWQRLNWRITVGCAFISMMLLGGFALATLDAVALGSAFLGFIGFFLSVTARKEFVS